MKSQPRFRHNMAIFLVKASLVLLLFLTFYGMFSVIAPQLLLPTRTMVITVMTLVVTGFLFLRIYGGFDLGGRKSRDLIISLALAVGLTDIISFIALTIMVRFEMIGEYYMLLLVYAVQLVLIIIYAYFGNWLFFQFHPPEKSILIYGAGADAGAFLQKIARYPKQWDVQISLADDTDNLIKKIFPYQSVFLLGIPSDLQNDIQELCYKYGKNIYFVPNLSDVIVKHSKTIIIDDKTTYASLVSFISPEQRVVKRLMDVFVSAIGIIIASPFMLVAALAVKLGDRGPVFYRQRRVTENGKTFELIKFRTMIVDAEKESGIVWAGKDDKRITPVGRVLRKLRLDELPQLFNILKGEMSVVGPRPEREELIEEFVKSYPEFRYRLKVKAGLTGLAQVTGKYNTTPIDKLIMDLEYIENYSIWRDLKILFQTAKVLFKSDSTEGVETEPVHIEARAESEEKT